MGFLTALLTLAAGNVPVNAVPDVTSLPCVRIDPQTARYEYTGDLGSWMSCLYPPGSERARVTRMGAIMMPGSHGAGTDAFFAAEASTFHYAVECPSAVDRAAKGIPWVTRQWAMAQTRSTANQAALGSRWFELRGVFDNYLWRSCDGLVADRWYDVVRDLVAFEESHPGEAIVLDLAHLVSPMSDVSASRLVAALAPACRRALGPSQAPTAAGNPGVVTLDEARAGGGFIILVSDSVSSHRAYDGAERWLALHNSDPCVGKLWRRSGTLTHADTKPNANLWINRRAVPQAASHLVRWSTAHVTHSRGFFQVSQFTWDFSGPSNAMTYQIWLMNHWLIDYNRSLGPPTRHLARALWLKHCRTGIPANVILLDNITRPRPLRELISYNDAPCP